MTKAFISTENLFSTIWVIMVLLLINKIAVLGVLINLFTIFFYYRIDFF